MSLLVKTVGDNNRCIHGKDCARAGTRVAACEATLEVGEEALPSLPGFPTNRNVNFQHSRQDEFTCGKRDAPGVEIANPNSVLGSLASQYAARVASWSENRLPSQAY